MIFEEVEEACQKQKLKELLDKYKDIFQRVEDYGNQFREGIIDSPHIVDSAMSELIGIFVSLNTATIVLESETRAKEDLCKEEKKKDIISNESSIINLFRRMRNIFRAYRDNCEKLITVCQSRLRTFDKEKYLKYD